jgi:hypothetical protein
MVFLLGRMGNNKKALTLIIERLGDVHRVCLNLLFFLKGLWHLTQLQAIDFAKEQSDDDLWEDLLMYSETRPGSSALLVSPSLTLTLCSIHPRPTRKHRRRDQPYPAHPPHQERARDSWVKRGLDQDSAGFPSSNLFAGGMSDDIEWGQLGSFEDVAEETE